MRAGGGAIIPKDLVAGPEAMQAAVLGSEEGVMLRGLRAKGCLAKAASYPLAKGSEVSSVVWRYIQWN